MMSLRLSISSSMFPNFRGQLCLQRPTSSRTLSLYAARVQSLSVSVPNCRRCQPSSRRGETGKTLVPAADGERDASSCHCRSCGDAGVLGTSGRKPGDSVECLVLGRNSWTQGLQDGGILGALQDSNAYFVGNKRLYGFQTWNPRSNLISTSVSAVPSRLSLTKLWIEQGVGLGGEVKLFNTTAHRSYSCSASSLYAISQDHPNCSVSSRSCFSHPERGLTSGADSWGLTSLPPPSTSQPFARFSSSSGSSWLPEDCFKYKTNSRHIKGRGGPARYMYSIGGPLSDKFRFGPAPLILPCEDVYTSERNSSEGAAGSQKLPSAFLHLATPMTDHPSCADRDSSKGSAAPGLLPLGSQDVLLWGDGDMEHPVSAGTRHEDQYGVSRSDSLNFTHEGFPGLNGRRQHEDRALAVDDQRDDLTKHTVNPSTRATQFVIGEDETVPEGQMETAVMKALERSLGSPLGREPQIPPPKPLVIVISGPSGVGKDVVIKKLQQQRNGIHFVVTATTRPQRPGEVEGHDYFFVSKEQFKSMIDKGELLEHAVVYGDFKGIPKQQVRDCMAKGTDVVLRVDVQGAATVRTILGSNAVFIFLLAESEASLVKRLVTRKTETLDKVVLRIATAREELKRLDEFDYAVVNAEGQLDRTVSSICSIIDAEKSRVHQRTAII